MFTIEESVTRKHLRKIKVPTEFPRSEYSSGARWMPIQHGELADTIVSTVEKKGLHIASESWKTYRKGMGLIGHVDFDSTGKVDLPDGMKLSLGLKHSNDGLWALTFVVGARVFICSNGMVSGEFVVKRKHTTGMKMKSFIRNSVKKFIKQSRAIGPIVDDMKEFDIEYPTEEHILCESARRNIMPWSKLGKVDRNFRQTPYEEFEDNNGWSLYNAYTQVAKEQPEIRQLAVMSKMRELILEVKNAA